MRKFVKVGVVAAGATMAVGLAGPAFAANAGTGADGLQGNQDCYLNATKTTYGTPGQMFKDLPSEYKNVADWVKTNPTVKPDTVGDWVAVRCR